MQSQYEACRIDFNAIRRVVDVCLQNVTLHAGICCYRLEQLVSVQRDIEEINRHTTRITEIHRHPRRIEVKFDNESFLEVYVANGEIRGLHFHYLLVDSNVDEYFQNDVLRPMMWHYPFPDEDNSAQIEALLEFAEDMLHEPLHSWQKDMLTCLYNNQIYISGGRSSGRQMMVKIYDEWIRYPHVKNGTDEIGEITLTYEQLMQQSLKPNQRTI